MLKKHCAIYEQAGTLFRSGQPADAIGFLAALWDKEISEGPSETNSDCYEISYGIVFIAIKSGLLQNAEEWLPRRFVSGLNRHDSGEKDDLVGMLKFEMILQLRSRPLPQRRKSQAEGL